MLNLQYLLSVVKVDKITVYIIYQWEFEHRQGPEVNVLYHGLWLKFRQPFYNYWAIWSPISYETSLIFTAE